MTTLSRKLEIKQKDKILYLKRMGGVQRTGCKCESGNFNIKSYSKPRSIQQKIVMQQGKMIGTE